MDVADDKDAADACSASSAAATIAGTGCSVDAFNDTRSNSLLLHNDDVLDTVLTLCDLQAIGRLALTCHHLSAL